MKDDFMRPIQSFTIKAFMHILGLTALLWVSGATVSFFTNESSLLGVNLAAIDILYKWDTWLISSWTQLPWSSYNYLKIKLALSSVVPFIVSIAAYIKFWTDIKDWDPIPQKESIFGDARWATQADVKRAGLRSKEGMLLGVDKGGYFVADGFQHALLFAPTGSGKGVGFVIPNLLFWHHSMIVHDIKLENYELTSGWRAKQGQECYVWEPSNPDGRTHCYNPIDWVSSKPGQMVDDVQKIANLIIEEKDFWNNEARSLFLGVTLYLLADITKAKSFGEVVRTLRSDDVVYNLAVVMDTLGGVMHPVAYMNLAAFLQKADKERSGVISTLNSSLELWANPLIDTATASSDFNIQEFKKKKVTVYVGLTPDNINRLQKLMRIFYQQASEFLSRKMPDLKEEPYGVMFLLDEFPTLGKMEQIKAGIAYFRGYRVRLFLIIQDTQQLKGTYEEAGMNSFLSNSTFRITFAANNHETANLISQLCGNKTVEQISSSRPKFFDLNPATRTQNVSSAQRALLLPQEVIQLPRDEQIVLIESMPPIRSKKIFYFKDKFFTDRLLPPVFIPTQTPYDPSKARKAEEAPASETEEEITDDDTLEEPETVESLEDTLDEMETREDADIIDEIDSVESLEEGGIESEIEDDMEAPADIASIDQEANLSEDNSAQSAEIQSAEIVDETSATSPMQAEISQATISQGEVPVSETPKATSDSDNSSSNVTALIDEMVPPVPYGYEEEKEEVKAGEEVAHTSSSADIPKDKPDTKG